MREVLQFESHGLLGIFIGFICIFGYIYKSISTVPPKPLSSKTFFHFPINDNNANCVLKPFL